MPAHSWHSVQEPDLDREDVVALAQYAWASHLALPQQLMARRRLREHLQAAHGLLGYACWSALGRKRYYLLTVWETEQALVSFGAPLPPAVQGGPPRVAPTWIIQWAIPSDLYPPTWHEAFAKAIAEIPGKILP